MSRARPGARSAVGTLLAALVALAAWWLAPGGGEPEATPTPAASAAASTGVALDDDLVVDGLRSIGVAALPAEARRTLALIDAGGPFPYPERDGAVFSNRERLLPQQRRGYYREYTVPTPGSPDRGARRIVAGSGGERYWTADHYASFRRIVGSTGSAR